VIANVGILTFVVASMAPLGLSLTINQILTPLRNGRLVIIALLANFVLVPALAFAIKALIPMDEGYAIGLILLATAAGAPFLPKLVQVAKGAIALSVGIMVLLMVTTVIYVPLVLPLLLPGVTVNPLDIASVAGGVDVNPAGYRALYQKPLRNCGGKPAAAHGTDQQHGADVGLRGNAAAELALAAVHHR
jgi:predicted Na+-dependent transporter